MDLYCIKHYWSQKLLIFESLTDLHCTNTVPHCTGHWYILYSTVHHCTFLLNCTVQYWTILYVSTDMHCTVLNNAVRFDWLVLYSTEPHCTWNSLSSIIRFKITCICYFLAYVKTRSCHPLYIYIFFNKLDCKGERLQKLDLRYIS